MGTYKPKLIVLDLDDTLWPFHVDCTVTGPFHQKHGKVYDSDGVELKPYSDVPKILERLSEEGFTLAAASKTTMPRYSEQLLKFYDWNKYFTYKEIYPGSKKSHFEKLKKDSGIEYRDMLFFDDEYANINTIKSLGVTCVFIKGGGLTLNILSDGLEQHKNKLMKTGL